MPKRPSDPEFRSEVAAKFKQAIKDKGLTKKAAALDLGVTRQSIGLYIRGKVLPGPEVIRRAMELWKIDLTYRDHKLTLESMSAQVPQTPSVLPSQMSLWDVIKKLDNQSVKVEIRDKDINSIELKVSINFAS